MDQDKNLKNAFQLAIGIKFYPLSFWFAYEKNLSVDSKNGNHFDFRICGSKVMNQNTQKIAHKIIVKKRQVKF